LSVAEWIFAIFIGLSVVSLLNQIDNQLRRIAAALEKRNASE